MSLQIQYGRAKSGTMTSSVFPQKVLILVPSFHAQILTSTSSEMELKLENEVMFLVMWMSSLLSRKWKT